MIFSYLTRHWTSRRQYGIASWLLCVLRSLRVFRFMREHRALCDLHVVAKHVAASGEDDLFHHLSHRDYLVKGLGARQRVAAALSHYRFENITFDDAYQHAVYGLRRLPLWRHEADGNSFTIQLEMASRSNAEGDLTVALIADGICLHRLSYSWIDGRTLGLDMPIVPFVARNQGRWIDSGAAFDAFERVFPNNSPSFFCFAAMQGIAQAAGMDRLVAIRAVDHIAYDPDPAKHFDNAYDGFWKILGGVEMPAGGVTGAGTLGGYLIALPFYVKPLSEMPSKHRKRAAQRREHWRLICESAGAALARHLVHAPVRVAQPEPVAADTPAAVAPMLASAIDPAHLAH
jgi:uncharacterized protein VirK/YbjX